MDRAAQLDFRYVWHPFTQMRDWLKQKPIVIARGNGAMLTDTRGRRYIDANSSIWTNLHGHNIPALNRAIRRQLGKIAHSSALGLANELSGPLAEKLIRAATHSGGGRTRLRKVFFSDDGSTAMEVALKLAFEHTRRTRGQRRPRFLSLAGAYHGDTVGAVSLGHIDLFHKRYSALLFSTDEVAAPYCYRCPHNRAKPQRADAREYRDCKRECVASFEQTLGKRRKLGREPYAAFVFEPRMQGAAGMIAQPDGWLREVTTLARDRGALLVADEVLTGFGRAGVAKSKSAPTPLFACGAEKVRPDLMAVAKGLSGGYLPLAATLTSKEIFDSFLGEYEELKTFFHGHSYTGNQLGSAAGFSSMELLESGESRAQRAALQANLTTGLEHLWSLENVGDIRQVGLMAGVELVRDWKTRERFALAEKAGIRVCEAMARRGVLTRSIGNVIVIMPPYCTTAVQVKKIVSALADSVEEQLVRR